MPHNLKVREDVVTSIAVRLKRNMLSADEFQRELSAMTRLERASLVEYLDRMEKCPEEWNRRSAVA